MALSTEDKNFVNTSIAEGTKLMSSVHYDLAVDWCRIFANSILKVSRKIGVVIRLIPKNDCFWISIEPSYNYLGESSDNLPLIGYDFHYFIDDEEFQLFTSVGARNAFYNQRLFPKLNNSKNISAIVDNYSDCVFEPKVRFNKIHSFIWTNIKNYDEHGGSFNDLKELLDIFCKDGIYFPSMTKDQCIDKLDQLGQDFHVKDYGCINWGIDELNGSRRNEYNVLEYFNIITPSINCKKFLAEDPATIAEFERQLEQHIIGMILIDLIYREDPRVVEKIKKLIDRIRAD